MFEFFGGDEGLRIRGEALDDGGRDGNLYRALGLSRVRVLSPGPATFVNEIEHGDHLGETLGMFQEADD